MQRAVLYRSVELTTKTYLTTVPVATHVHLAMVSQEPAKVKRDRVGREWREGGREAENEGKVSNGARERERETPNASSGSNIALASPAQPQH